MAPPPILNAASFTLKGNRPSVVSYEACNRPMPPETNGRRFVLGPPPWRSQHDVAHQHDRATALDQGAVAFEEPWRPHEEPFNAQHAPSEQRDRAAEIPVNVAAPVVWIKETRVAGEREADRRREVPLGSGRARACDDTQTADCEQACHDFQGGTYFMSRRNSVANRDFETSPVSRWKGALSPSLFASRMKVTCRSGSFRNSDE